MEGFRMPFFGLRYAEEWHFGYQTRFHCRDCGARKITDRVLHDRDYHNGFPSQRPHWASNAAALEETLRYLFAEASP